jgi:hypothetical protein
MPTTIYDIKYISLSDGTEVEVSPLKIKYLKEFMDIFELLKDAKGDDESLNILTRCIRVAMKQYYPQIKTVEDVEDSIDLPTIYQILDISAGIKMNKPASTETEPEPLPPINNASDNSSWKNLDLAKLETEVFILGIWKNFDELESSISMPELMAILESRRELDYNEKKFLAAMQGVDLDEASKKNEPDPWEAMKARVAAKASGIGNGDPNDILSLQGQKAQQYGFGIGMGLDYEVIGKD